MALAVTTQVDATVALLNLYLFHIPCRIALLGAINTDHRALHLPLMRLGPAPIGNQLKVGKLLGRPQRVTPAIKLGRAVIKRPVPFLARLLAPSSERLAVKESTHTSAFHHHIFRGKRWNRRRQFLDAEILKPNRAAFTLQTDVARAR